MLCAASLDWPGISFLQFLSALSPPGVSSHKSLRALGLRARWGLIMWHFKRKHLDSRTFILWLAGLAGCVALGVLLVSCGGGIVSTQGVVGSGTGSMTVSLSDPPSCAFPNGNFD